MALNQDIAIVDAPIESAITLVDNPLAQLAAAKELATALIDMVDQTGGAVTIGKGQHLRVEAWQFIGFAYGISPRILDSEIKQDLDGAMFYETKVELIDRNGVIVGDGVARCGFDENVSKGQSSGGAQRNAALSMSQTRAISKAFRNKMSWIVMLGGYSPTPAEEVINGKEFERRSEAAAKRFEDRPDDLTEDGFKKALGTQNWTLADLSAAVQAESPFKTFKDVAAWMDNQDEQITYAKLWDSLMKYKQAAMDI